MVDFGQSWSFESSNWQSRVIALFVKVLVISRLDMKRRGVASFKTPSVAFEFIMRVCERNF